MYVTYLTTYKGNMLPMFYIGSTSLKKITSGKYFGSPRSKKWKDKFYRELKSHPHLFSVEILSYHTTHIEAIEREFQLQIERDAVNSEDYMNEAYASKSFNHGKPHTEETKKKIGESNSVSLKSFYENGGEPTRLYGKDNPQFQTVWMNNGKENRRVKKEDVESAVGWKIGRIMRWKSGEHPHANKAIFQKVGNLEEQ